MHFTLTYKHFAVSVLYWTQTLGATLIMVLMGWALLMLLTVLMPVFIILEKAGYYTLDVKGLKNVKDDDSQQ